MKIYQVTDYSTGEVFQIEAESAFKAGEAFRKEGKAIKVELMNTTEEKIVKTPKVHNKHASTAPADAVYIGRGSKWGNPFVIGKDGNREEVIAKYKQYILANTKLLADLHEIKDRDLVCFCAPQPCHGDVLIFLANNTQGETVKTQPPQAALKKLEKMTPEEVAEITALLEKNILPHLKSDVSNYAKGRQRVWLPYEAPLGNQPFTAGLMDGEVWQWIVDHCDKHGFKAQVALISKGGNIKPHRDTTYAAPWAMGFNLGKCDWHIASARDAAKPDYTMNLNGGEVFTFNSKHVHSVTNAAEDRWSINVWAIATGPAADNANIAGRLEKMLDENPEVQEFIELHRPGAVATKSKEDTTMAQEPNNKKEAVMDGKFVIAGTGTRQLMNESKEYRHKVLNHLKDLLTQAKAKHGDNLIVVSGMAEGFDEALARAAVAVGVPFVAAVPNPSYINYYWTRSVTGNSRITQGIDLLGQASEVVYVCQTHTSTLPKYSNRAGTANFERNEWMVDRADVVWAFYPVDDAGNVLPLTSGTKHCVNYAEQKKVKVFKVTVDKNDGGGKAPEPTPNNPQEGPQVKKEAGFKGTYLSNFWPAKVEHEGLTYSTVENFYQAMRLDDRNARKDFVNLHPAEAKKKGRMAKRRNDWNPTMAENVMLHGLRQKFSAGSELANMLLATGNEELVETNYWHDLYWGKCTCEKHNGQGDNKLGILLMQVRDELRNNNGGGGTPKPTPNSPEEGPNMKQEQEEKTVKLSEKAQKVLSAWIKELDMEPPTPENVAVDMKANTENGYENLWFHTGERFWTGFGHRYFVYNDFMTEGDCDIAYYEGSTLLGSQDLGMLGTYIGEIDESIVLTEEEEQQIDLEIAQYLISIGSHESPWVTTNQYVFDFYQTGQEIFGEVKWTTEMLTEEEIARHQKEADERFNKKKKEEKKEVKEEVKEKKPENKMKDNSEKTPKKGGHSMIGEIKEYLVETMLLSDVQQRLQNAPGGESVGDVVSVGRVITNDPSYWFDKDNTVVLEEVDRGDYHFALLEHLFGDKSFIVNITGWTNPISKETHKVLMSKSGKNPPTDSIFGWADFDSETFIRIKDHGNKGWSNLSEYGLHVGNSSKMTKRLVELTKSVRGYAIHKNNDSRLRIKVLTYEQMLKAFPYLKTEEKAGKPADGVSMLAVETAKYIYRRNNKASKSSKARILHDIDNKKITNHTLRILTNLNGTGMLVKGNALTAPRSQMNARMVELGFISDGEIYDVFTSVDNCKTEFGTDGSFEIATLEPHHKPGLVKTNDQTMSKFMGVPGMFDPKELLEAFQVVLDKAYNNMVEGKDIQFLENISPLKPRTEAEKIAEIMSSKVTNQVNKMAATLKALDLPIGVSQTLMLQRANLMTKMFLSETTPVGKNWMAPSREKKSFLFMPWAYRAYIMSKEMVYMLGYDVDLNNMEAQYHAETQTIMVPGVLYDEIMAKLGGGDADDEVMVHIRKMICKDGSVRLVAVLIRTPDDWAEYWIIDVDIDNMGPVFLADDDGIDLPTIYEKDFDKFKISSVCGQLPSAINGSNRPNPETWDWDSTYYNFQAGYHYKGQSVGGQVKTKMLHYSTFNKPFDTLPCANEDMIDALQQCKGTIEDLMELNEWSSEATAEMLMTAKLDAYWWHSRNMDRTVKALTEGGYMTSALGSLAPYESPIVTELMIPRENMVREMYSKMLHWLNNNIMEIPELNICIHKQNEMKFRKLVTELNNMFLIPESQMVDQYGRKVKMTKAQRSEHFEKAAKAVADRFASYKERLNDDVQFNKFILSLVRMSWIRKTEAIAKSYDTKNPRHNYDRWLYTAVSDADTIITDYFFEAMLWFRETYKKKS